jgi:hypothetical protein
MAARAPIFAVAAGALLVGASLAEAVAVAVQARGAPHDSDWARVKAALEGGLAAEEGVLVGTRWIEPLARHHLGDGVLTRSRVGAPVNTWPRVAVVAEAGGGAVPEGYTEERVIEAGALEVHFARAAHPFAVRGRAEASLAEAQAFVEAEGHEAPCTWGTYGLVAGNLGSGPAWPSERFLCPGVTVARSFVTDTTYRPHDAIFVDVPGDGRTVVVRFAPSAIGTAVRGGFGLYVEAERDAKGAPVSLEWRVDGRTIGSLVHRDGEGWKGFELGTGVAPGAVARAELRLRSPGGQRRLVGVSAAFVEVAP